MSDVSFMEKLLDGVVVEWKALNDLIVSLKTGLNPRQNFQLNTSDAEGYYVTVREIQNGKVTFHDKTDRVSKTALGLINNRSNLEVGDILFSGTGTVGRTAVIKEAPKNWNIKEGVYVIKPFHDAVDSRYLSHLLNSQEIKKEYSRKIVGSPVISLPMGELKKLQIPIPCPDNPEKSLEIQAEIVRILDTFTELTAELTAELSMRKKQYNYYRDKLLTFEEGEVEWKALGEVCEVGDGNHSSKYPRSDEMVEEGIPFIRGTNMVNGTISGKEMKFITPEKHNALKKGHLKAYDVLITNRGEIGKIAQVPKHFCGSNLNSQLAWLRANPDVILPRYLFYVLNATHVQSSISGEGGALQQLTIKNIKLIRIPVPQIKEQNRIVTILDKIYTLTNSITEGLPREIELRQQQYEYYRDLLLSFPKSAESDAVSA